MSKKPSKGKPRKDWRPKCAECGGLGELITGAEIYPHRPDLAGVLRYRCACGAHVGTHKGTYKPLGFCAGPEAHKARIAAHASLDALWRAKMARDGVSQGEARPAAYKWLAREMNLSAEDCHIGMFSADQARRVVQLCEPYLANLRRTG